MADVEKQGIIVGISGGGSTLKAVYDATQDGTLPRTRLAGVFSSNPNAKGLDIARTFKGLDPEKDVVFIDPDLPTYGPQLVNFLESHWVQFELFCQYGLAPFTPEIVIDWLDAYGKKGINQHGGSVNPDEWDFGGPYMSCPERVHAARMMFVRETGRNPFQHPVAQAIAKTYDGGVVYKRGAVPILDHDRVPDLKARTIKEEHRVQIGTLADFETGRVMIQRPMEDLVLERERPLVGLVKGVSRKLYDKHGNEIAIPNLKSLVPVDNPDLIYDIRRLVGSLYPLVPDLNYFRLP